MRTLAFVALFSLTLAARPAHAAAATSETGVRASHPIGAYVSLWGDPFPALYGLNVAYHVYDFIRLNAGVGTESTKNITATTFGIGAKAFVPGWDLSPAVGLGWSVDNLSGAGGSVNMRGLQHGGNRLYGTVGLDWQTRLGLSFGAGYARAFGTGAGGSAYVSAGIFL